MLTLLAVLLAAGPGAERASAASACKQWGNVPSNSLTKDQARRAILCLLNRKRDQKGIPNLSRHRRTQRAAQNHTEYMHSHGCFAHQCPGEPSLVSRLGAVNYLISGLLRWAYAENIAWGEGQGATPGSMVRAWMDSSGHRANILNPSFRDLGVGFVRGTPYSRTSNGGIYTTDFGLRVR